MTGREPPSLGPRGEGWVALQALLLAAIGVFGLFGPRWPTDIRPWLWAISLIGWAGGVWLFVAGVGRLGRHLTPFPKPVEEGELRTDGAYALVRHPIYGGVLVLCLAWSAVSSPVALAPTALLALLFEGKRRREELWLEEAHPEYAEYRRRVPRRFIPFVW